ncbi:EF-hand domain-containing protein [Caulobacter hibisci]|uniref:EF-hand domain-containing protein n=1 Tax=Caulobacter hibisci TaxID=2035993 RepID=A0ABS0SSB0_9CAUL|nr:EF-hand domain-containing protein [Caulobacter hibisci]MBI1682525.1 EF-hand domain-containing protein [Caulobacter hibisci]
MIRKSLILAAALAAVSAPAFAASHARDTFIKEQDVNGDGVVSKEEFVITRDQLFKAIDADKNGSLSKEEYVGEFKARLEKRLAASTDPAEKKEEERVRQMRQADVRFGVLDSDKSGAITAAEFAYSGWRMFVTHDTNKDGTVSAADPVPADTN